MRLRRLVALASALVAVAACSPDGAPSGSPATVSPSGTPSSPAPPTTAPPKPTVKPTVKPTPPKPTPPKPSPPPGVALTAKGAYLQASEDENLTTPDPENGCAVHDPDLDDVSCGVVSMAGGRATWIVGREQNVLPGASEPRLVVRIYRRLKNGTDSLTYTGIGDPGNWASVDVRAGSLTGQTRDTLVVVVTLRGTGTYAGYDLVTWRKASPMKLVAHHPEGAKARVFVRAKGYISTYTADYSNGAPNCCPTSWQHDNVKWHASHFRMVKLKNVSQPPSS